MSAYWIWFDGYFHEWFFLPMDEYPEKPVAITGAVVLSVTAESFVDAIVSTYNFSDARNSFTVGTHVLFGPCWAK